LPEIAAPAPPPVAQVDPSQNNNDTNNNDANNNDSGDGDSGNDNGNDNSSNAPLPIIPIIPAVLLPSPPPNVNVTKVCELNFPNITQKSTVTWGDTGSETGYVVYRNGVAIANLGANVTQYIDSFNALLIQGGQVKYGVQTVIGNASSSPAEKTIAVCN
jgi:hypothetical protein